MGNPRVATVGTLTWPRPMSWVTTGYPSGTRRYMAFVASPGSGLFPFSCSVTLGGSPRGREVGGAGRHCAGTCACVLPRRVWCAIMCLWFRPLRFVHALVECLFVVSAFGHHFLLRHCTAPHCSVCWFGIQMYVQQCVGPDEGGARAFPDVTFGLSRGGVCSHRLVPSGCSAPTRPPSNQSGRSTCRVGWHPPDG